MSGAPWWQVVAALLVLASVHPATTGVVRWADDRSLLVPVRPRCLTDDHDLSVADVVPLVSWIRLRGHCRTCRVAIPRRLPLVELAVVVLVGAVVVAHPGLDLVLLGPVAWSLVVATAIDLEHLIIPNRLTLPLAGWSLVAVTVLAVVGGAWGDWRRAVLTGVAVPAVMLGMSLLFELVRGQPGMGMGDVKWAPSLGIAVGWLGAAEVFVFVYTTVIAAGVVAVALLVTGRAGNTRVPYGPYLAIGAAVTLLTGDSLLRLVVG